MIVESTDGTRFELCRKIMLALNNPNPYTYGFERAKRSEIALAFTTASPNFSINYTRQSWGRHRISQIANVRMYRSSIAIGCKRFNKVNTARLRRWALSGK